MDEALVASVRRALDDRPGMSERKMFGGVAFLLNGNLCCGVTKDGVVVVRVGPRAYDDALGHPEARECDFTGRPLRGMVMLEAQASRSRARLRRWIERAAEFAGALPRRPRKGKLQHRRRPTRARPSRRRP